MQSFFDRMHILSIRDGGNVCIERNQPYFYGATNQQPSAHIRNKTFGSWMKRINYMSLVGNAHTFQRSIIYIIFVFIIIIIILSARTMWINCTVNAPFNGICTFFSVLTESRRIGSRGVAAVVSYNSFCCVKRCQCQWTIHIQITSQKCAQLWQ